MITPTAVYLAAEHVSSVLLSVRRTRMASASNIADVVEQSGPAEW